MQNKNVKDKKIAFKKIPNIVFPYIDDVLTYLNNPGTDVSKFMKKSYSNQQAPVRIKWNCSFKSVAKFEFHLSINKNYKGETIIILNKNARHYDLYNLYKATKYFIKIIAYNENGKTIGEDSTSFLTTDLGPRIMNVDGIHNGRDLGGYLTPYGRTKQGFLYRGGTLTAFDGYISNITHKGKRQMKEELKIKSELDLRSFEEVGISKTSIPNAHFYYLTIDGYESAFSPSYKEAYRKVFSFLANSKNYPIYMHCTGGADRTGTIAFLFNSFLGVSEIELIQDYELTSFSIFGIRNSKGDDVLGKHFQEFYRILKNNPGDTLQEKSEYYLQSIGVSKLELKRIKKIMFDTSHI